MGIIWKTQATSKAIRSSKIIPKTHFPETIWKCVCSYSIFQSILELYFLVRFWSDSFRELLGNNMSKKYKKIYKTTQHSCLHPQVAKLLLATMETGKGDTKCQVLQALKSLLCSAESQGTSTLAGTEHMRQSKCVKCSFSIYNPPCAVSESWVD